MGNVSVPGPSFFNLKVKGSRTCTVKDIESVNGCKVQKEKLSSSVNGAMGNIPRASKALTTKDEELLWSKGACWRP